MSAHAMGAAMPLGALIYLDEPFFIFISSFLLLIICFARIYLKVHTLLQVIAGSLIGFTVAFVLLKYCI
jgi:membrane-associated phospholipid phosphatase